MVWTRRTVMRLMGAAGGAAGAAAGMEMMGLRGGASAMSRPVLRPGQSRILILGGGIAGLTAAYELGKAGHRCTIVEAQDQLGGRNRTIRDGDKVSHRSGTQTAAMAEGDYFNAGPARLPGFHRNLVSYCRTFGVPLEPFAYENQNAFLVSSRMNSGRPIRHRHYRYSVMAFEDELAFKSLDAGRLDIPLDAAEAEAAKMLLGLATMREGPFGGGAATRAGFLHWPDAGMTEPVAIDPLPLAELVKVPEMAVAMSTFDYFEWQTMLLQPRGGMDRIVEAFDRRLDARKILGAEVVALRKTDDGVTAVLRDRKKGDLREIDGDAAIVALPLPIAAEWEMDGTDAQRAAITKGATTWAPASKLGWPAKRRFWEEDEEIFGGASMIDGEPMQFWYPSSGFLSPTGVLLGAYTVGEAVERWSQRSREEQATISRRFGRMMHKGFDAGVGEPIAIDWGDQPFARGGWGTLNGDLAPGAPYDTLRTLTDRIVFAGDYLSHFVGWQEGAVLSAHHAAEQVAALVTQNG